MLKEVSKWCRHRLFLHVATFHGSDDGVVTMAYGGPVPCKLEASRGGPTELRLHSEEVVGELHVVGRVWGDAQVRDVVHVQGFHNGIGIHVHVGPTQKKPRRAAEKLHTAPRDNTVAA